jgi:hypothetical protein
MDFPLPFDLERPVQKFQANGTSKPRLMQEGALTHEKS